MDTRFIIGQIVCLRADASRTGPIIEVLPPLGRVPRYRVFHAPGEIREYQEDQLLSKDTPAASMVLAEALVTERWLDAQTFRARLTAQRLAHPQTDNLYAFQAARIKHIPFQFKPLLRLLRSDRPRLLIADEVGVGKTIEAGLILKELQTRQQVDNVLIVCPKALVTKWQKEMRRFDEDFQPLTADTLRYCLRETHLEGAWPSQYKRAIVHLELLRVEGYLVGTNGRQSQPGLMTLDPPPQFSLTIFDEAHHLRNPDTNSHELAQFFCDVSEAVVFLSATPVHVGSRNLYSLVSMLRPDLFPDEAVFNEIVEPNQHITQAMRHVRSRIPAETWQEKAASALSDAARTSWGQQRLRHDPRFTEWLSNLYSQSITDDIGRLRCLRDLEELHSLSNVMNRTRRRDVGRFTLRDPQTIPVPFTPDQQSFYDALIAFRREVLSLTHAPQVIRLITDTLERQAASCLPALIPTLDAFIQTGRFSTVDISDDPDADELTENLPPHLVQQAQTLRTMATSLPPHDPKLDQLIAIVESTLHGTGPGKVLIFSFFLHTLAYLEHQLRSKGYRVAVITGRVPDEERERLRDRFRSARPNSDALDILLSSEVGCEGLDYEFCDRLVNYDIPWNPMRVEQRIGRIDRFGQASEKVLIYNFVTPGTVEERIFFRCFNRLDIFRNTIGDLEEVLGNVVQDLTRVALDPTLTPEQVEEKVRQAADNAVRYLEEQRRLEEESTALLGLDTAIMDEVDTLVAQGRFIAPEDLRVMVNAFIETPGIDGKMTADERNPGLFRLRMRRDSRNALLEHIRRLGQHDRVATTFTRWLEGIDQQVPITFEQQTALDQRDVPFITPVHPLARAAITYWINQTDPLVSYLMAIDDEVAPERYVFVCDLWETLGAKPELRLVISALNCTTGQDVPIVAAKLMKLITNTTLRKSSTGLSLDLVKQYLHQLDETAQQLRLETLKQVQERNDALINLKLASLDTYYRKRITRVQEQHRQANDVRIIRMKESEQARIEQDFQRKRSELEKHRHADIISQRIAVGVIEVKREN